MRRIYPALEWAVLLLAAPFLLFPTVRAEGTLAALVGLALFWLVSAVLRRPWPETPFNGALLLFAVGVGVGTLVTAWPEVTLPKATGLILGLGVFRAMAALRGQAGWRWGALVLGGLGVGIAAVGVLSAHFYTKIPIVAPLVARLPERLLTLPEGPEGGVSANQLAGVLAFYLPLTLGWLWSAIARMAGRGQSAEPRRPSRLRSLGTAALNLGILLVALLSIGITAGLLVITQSRSGWIGGAGGVLALGALAMGSARQRWLHWLVVGVVALTLIGGGVFLVRVPAETWDRLWGDTAVLETEVTGSVSFSGRVEIWSRALYAIQDFPFTGCGLGTLRKVIPLLYPLFTVSPENDIAHAHNIFLQTAADVGLPGLIAYVALLGLAAVVAWKFAPRRGLPLLAALLALHLYGLTDAVALGSKPGIVFWAALGLLAALAASTDVAQPLPLSPLPITHNSSPISPSSEALP